MRLGGRSGCGRGGGFGGGWTGAGQAEAAAGKLLDGASLAQCGEHFEEVAAIVLAKAEALGDVVRENGVSSKLQKTKDIVDAKVRGTRHQESFWEEREVSTRIFSKFFKKAETIFGKLG